MIWTKKRLPVPETLKILFSQAQPLDTARPDPPSQCLHPSVPARRHGRVRETLGSPPSVPAPFPATIRSCLPTAIPSHTQGALGSCLFFFLLTLTNIRPKKKNIKPIIISTEKLQQSCNRWLFSLQEAVYEIANPHCYDTLRSNTLN